MALPCFLVLAFLAPVYCLESDLSSSYFCSTCFTNNQDQNYHCCFYFFKCCAEARRGSKSKDVHSPVLPTHIAYIVQGRTIQPCPKSCQGNVAFCCLSWNAQHSTANDFQAAQKFEADSTVKSSSEDASSAVLAKPTSDIDRPFHLAIGANMNPSHLDSNYFGSTHQLFIPPSLASGHDSKVKKEGWITKDLLKEEDDK
ncbi:uncharacterized protein TNIN_491841 [Trichonephila inaurata madagascariensis]|uniref:Secreted protein n=1 Tax=Trichonephila inaurata madagascariensis TaxID=2747483 RepID=A0A8X6X992_9ARAC|nr:uncharacterized protein TNIN_491841 [Trichonephila inaurata madagascariensis]